MKIRYTVLVKTIPDISKRDNTSYVCTIGIGYFANGDIRLIRVYPTPIKGMSKWHTYELEVERNKYDSRPESWKLSSMSRKNNWIGIGKDVMDIGIANKTTVNKWLSKLVVPSISTLNEARQSIGVLLVENKNIYKTSNENYYNNEQFPLFEDVGITVDLADYAKYTKDFNKYAYRISFKDLDGKHDLQFNEWGLYEGTRKGFKIDTNKLYGDKNLVVIGNINAHRNTWMALSVFSYLNSSQTVLTL